MSAAMLLATTAQAMTIRQYDKMADMDQARFVDVLIEAAQKVLIDQGQRDLAANVYQLFTEVRPGDKVPLGFGEYNENLAVGRVVDAKRLAADPNAIPVQVETAMIVTLKKNGFALTPDFSREYFKITSTFQPKYPPQK
jgi:hypothetical protein